MVGICAVIWGWVMYILDTLTPEKNMTIPIKSEVRTLGFLWQVHTKHQNGQVRAKSFDLLTLGMRTQTEAIRYVSRCSFQQHWIRYCTGQVLAPWPQFRQLHPLCGGLSQMLPVTKLGEVVLYFSLSEMKKSARHTFAKPIMLSSFVTLCLFLWNILYHLCVAIASLLWGLNGLSLLPFVDSGGNHPQQLGVFLEAFRTSIPHTSHATDTFPFLSNVNFYTDAKTHAFQMHHYNSALPH